MPKAIDLTPKKVATFGRLIEAVSAPSTEAANGDNDPLRQIGNAAFRGLLARMEQGEWLMPSANGNGATSSLKEVVETLDKVDELRTRGEDRLARRLKEAEERAEKAERALAQAQDNQVSGLGAIVQAFTTALTAMQQQTLTILQNQYNQTLQLINELRQASARPSDDGWLAQIGREAIQQALNRDPLADYERISSALDKALEKHLAHQRPGGMDPQTLAAYLSYDLERFKAQLQYELQKEGVQRSKEISEQIAEYLGRAAREKEEQEAEQAEERPRTARRPSARETRPAPEVYTYRCGACGEDFTLRRYATEVTCPHCGTRLVAQDAQHDERMTRLAQPAAAAPAGEVAEEPVSGGA